MDSCVWPPHLQAAHLYAISLVLCVLARVCRAVNKIRDGLWLWFYCINNPPVCIVQVMEPVLLPQSHLNIGLLPYQLHMS